MREPQDALPVGQGVSAQEVAGDKRLAAPGRQDEDPARARSRALRYHLSSLSSARCWCGTGVRGVPPAARLEEVVGAVPGRRFRRFLCLVHHDSGQHTRYRVGPPAPQFRGGTGRHRDGRRVPPSRQKSNGGGPYRHQSRSCPRLLSRVPRGRGRRRRVLGNLVGRGSRRRTGRCRRRGGVESGAVRWLAVSARRSGRAAVGRGQPRRARASASATRVRARVAVPVSAPPRRTAASWSRTNGSTERS